MMCVLVWLLSRTGVHNSHLVVVQNWGTQFTVGCCSELGIHNSQLVVQNWGTQFIVGCCSELGYKIDSWLLLRTGVHNSQLVVQNWGTQFTVVVVQNWGTQFTGHSSVYSHPTTKIAMEFDIIIGIFLMYCLRKTSLSMCCDLWQVPFVTVLP